MSGAKASVKYLADQIQYSEHDGRSPIHHPAAAKR